MKIRQKISSPIRLYLNTSVSDHHIPFKIGIINSFQNCYASASLQALFSLPQFVNTIRTIGDKYGNMILNTPFMKPMAELLQVVSYGFQCRDNNSVTLQSFLEQLYDQKAFGFNTVRNRQEDAVDFTECIINYLDKVMTILNALSNDFNVPTEILGFFSKNFKYKRDVTKFCENMHENPLQPRSNQIMYLMVNEDSLVAEIKKSFVRKTNELCLQCNVAYPYDDPVTCHNERSTLTSLPEVLGISLIFPTTDMRRGCKILRPFYIPETFSFDNVDESIHNYEYQLVSVVLHHGSDMQSGHYTAVTKNSIDFTWNHYDDTCVDFDVNPMDYINDNRHSRGQPSILFYTKRNTINTMVTDETLTEFIAAATKITCKKL